MSFSSRALDRSISSSTVSTSSPGSSALDLVHPDDLSARGLAPAEVDAAIERAVRSIRDGMEGKIVRLVVADVPRHVVRELDHRRIREWRAEALHFVLDPRPPEKELPGVLAGPVRGQSLEALVDDYLSHRWSPTMVSISCGMVPPLVSHSTTQRAPAS